MGCDAGVVCLGVSIVWAAATLLRQREVATNGDFFFIFTSFSFVVCRTKCLPKKLQICTCVAVTNVYCQMNFAVGQGLDPCHRLLSYSQMKQLYMVEPNFWQTKMCLI